MEYAHAPEDEWVSSFLGTNHSSMGRDGGDRNGFVQTLTRLATCSSVSHHIAPSSIPSLQSSWEPLNNLLLFIKNTQLGTQLGFSHPLPQPLLILAQISVEVLILKICIVHDVMHCHSQVPIYRNKCRDNVGLWGTHQTGVRSKQTNLSKNSTLTSCSLCYSVQPAFSLILGFPHQMGKVWRIRWGNEFAGVWPAEKTIIQLGSHFT